MKSNLPNLILPLVWPDETVYSLLARIARINGITDAEAIRRLLGEDRPVSIARCRVNVKHLSEVTRGAYGNPKDILVRLTVFSMLAHLGAISASTLFEVENGNQRPELGTLLFGINRGCRWRLCGECADRDAKTYGIAYWHRVHQLPSSQFCAEHGLKLDSFDLRRMRLHDHLVLPYDLSSMIADRDVHAICKRNDICWDSATLGRDALADLSEYFSERVIHATFMAGLEQRSLLTASGEVRLPIYLEEFRRIVGLESSSTVMLRQARVKDPKHLLDGITNQRTSGPFARLLLVNLLFKTWGAFKEQCKWQDVLGKGGEGVGSANTTICNSVHSVEAVLQQKRQICIAFKASHTNPTRYEFLRKCYRAFRWLRHHDRDWLDEELPKQKPRRQRKLFNN